jgi:hypothetical protein
MLYLESPAGVGFSYSTDPSFYGGVGDSMTGVTSILAKLYPAKKILRGVLISKAKTFRICLKPGTI